MSVREPDHAWRQFRMAYEELQSKVYDLASKYQRKKTRTSTNDEVYSDLDSICDAVRETPMYEWAEEMHCDLTESRAYDQEVLDALPECTDLGTKLRLLEVLNKFKETL